MQKAFPKVVLAVLVVVVLGVMLVVGLTGDGPANDRALRTVLIVVGVGMVVLIRYLWKKRGSREKPEVSGRPAEAALGECPPQGGGSDSDHGHRP